MSSSRRHWASSFVTPSRAVVLAIGFVSATVSVVPAFWILPFFAGLFILFSARLPTLSKPSTIEFILGVTGLVMITTLPRGPLSQVFADVRPQSMILVLGGVVTLWVASRDLRAGRRMRRMAWAAVAMWVAGAAVIAITADPEPWIDVWHLHGDAADAFRDGSNPYAGRSVPNPMSWFPEGSQYEGYPYPPVVMYLYAGADLLLGESRLVAVLAGIALVLLIRGASTTPTTDAVGLMLLLSPGWPLMVQLAWTEVASVLLLACALFFRHRLLTATLIGFVIASKQYLLLWAVPVATSWLNRRNLELLVAGLTSLGLYAIGAIYGWSDYMEWVFLFHIEAPPTELGASLPGLLYMLFQRELVFPLVVSLPLATGVGYYLASRKPRSDGSMILAATAMTSVFFFLGSQSFPNYWYLVLGGLVLSALTLTREGPTDEWDSNGKDRERAEVTP